MSGPPARGPRRERQGPDYSGNRTHPAATLARVADALLELGEDLQELAHSLANRLDECPQQSDVGGVETAIETAPKRRPFLTVRDVAERLQVDQKTVRRWRQEGRLPSPITLGGVIRWRPEAIEAWLDEQERSA